MDPSSPDNEADAIIAAFKIGSSDHIHQLLTEGHVYMNPAAFFRELKDTDPRFDDNECAAFCQFATGGKVAMDIGGKMTELGTLSGPILFRGTDETNNPNLYCMHVRRSADFGTPFDLSDLEFGDTALIFLDYVKFLRRLTEKAKSQGFNVSYRLVEYVDRATYTGPLGPFRKFSAYASENEHRIAIHPGTGRPISLHLGSLTDIAITVPVGGNLLLTRKELSA